MEKKTDFKALSSKAKVQYIWDYYKLHISFFHLPVAVTLRVLDLCPVNE